MSNCAVMPEDGLSPSNGEVGVGFGVTVSLWLWWRSREP
jgi:hypothetical protein